MSYGNGNQGFPTTNWELFALLQGEQPEQRGNALHALVSRYWPPLQNYLRAVKRLSMADAEEVRSCFTVERLLAEKTLFDQVDQGRGGFRKLLVCALEHFLVDLHRRRAARKELPPDALDDMLADTPKNPLAVFERTWARSILQQTLDAMRAHLMATDQEVTWLVFEQRVALPASDGVEPTPYLELVREFNLRTPVQVSNLVSSAKRVFERQLRLVLAAHAEEGENFDDQRVELQKILSQPAE